MLGKAWVGTINNIAASSLTVVFNIAYTCSWFRVNVQTLCTLNSGNQIPLIQGYYILKGSEATLKVKQQYCILFCSERSEVPLIGNANVGYIKIILDKSFVVGSELFENDLKYHLLIRYVH